MLWEGTRVKNSAKDEICSQCDKKNDYYKISLCPLNHDSSSGLSSIQDTAEPNEMTQTKVLMQTATTTVIRSAHQILDSGSQSTYVAEKLAKEI